MNSLAKLNTYSGSDSEEESSLQMSRLPLPNFLKNLSSEDFLAKEVNKEGKIRNFPHEPGNWATYIYIPVDSSEFSDCLDELKNSLRPLDLKVGDNFHISLTRTVILRHHWIPDFISSVRNKLKDVSAFKIHLFGLKAYINEQNTRSFLSLKVSEGGECLKSVANEMRDSFKEYNLQGFYEDPSFHLSLLWCPGDKFNEINSHIHLLPLKLRNFHFYKKVSHCVCAAGNKRFTFNFKQ